MKNLIHPVTFMFLLCIVSLPMSHGRGTSATNANLVDQTCRKTPNYRLCLSSLKSDPRSAHFDIYGLAVIMIDIVKAKATEAEKKINNLLRQSPRDKALKGCLYSYNTILQDEIPTSYQAIKLGRSMFAEQYLSDIANETGDCEAGFSRRFSPLKDMNKNVGDLGGVAAAIVRAFP